MCCILSPGAPHTDISSILSPPVPSINARSQVNGCGHDKFLTVEFYESSGVKKVKEAYGYLIFAPKAHHDVAMI
jgi:hypothetical protein